MKLIENQLHRWFGMNLNTAISVAIVASFTLLIAVCIVFAIIMLITNPESANNAHWGFAG